MTPQQRTMRARLAAAALHAKVSDPTAHTQPARDAFRQRFEREVDPDGVLEPAERARRAEQARKAFYIRLAYQSSVARAKARTVKSA